MMMMILLMMIVMMVVVMAMTSGDNVPVITMMAVMVGDGNNW